MQLELQMYTMEECYPQIAPMSADKHRLKEKHETIRVHLCLSVVKNRGAL